LSYLIDRCHLKPIARWIVFPLSRLWVLIIYRTTGALLPAEALAQPCTIAGFDTISLQRLSWRTIKWRRTIRWSWRY
jgi:hypothetical protein